MRNEFLLALDRYEASLPPQDSQRNLVPRFRELLELHADSAERTCFPGHLTGSAVIVTPDRSRTLLTHHRKLDRWLQLGGHADGSYRLDEVALREAQEESGLDEFRFVTGEILDLDVHWIPPGKEPGHFHYDVRYLLEALRPEAIVVSEESVALKWFGWDEAYAVSTEPSLTRLFDKTRLLQ